jgi:hypothetical protein
MNGDGIMWPKKKMDDDITLPWTEDGILWPMKTDGANDYNIGCYCIIGLQYDEGWYHVTYD